MRGQPWFLLALLAALPAAAGWEEPGGHLKLQLSRRLYQDGDLGAVLASERVDDLGLDLRFNGAFRHGRWDLTVEAQLLALAGDSQEARSAQPSAELAGALFGVISPAEDRQWWDLVHVLSEDEERILVGRLDRLSVGYTGDRLVLRLGRQALSWGNGLLFQALDLFNPFAPTAIDTDYKPGTDMLYGQWLFASGGDLQAIAVPRRAGAGEPVAGGESSLAVKWHSLHGGVDLDLLGARHYRDTVLGLGLTGSVAGGVWRLDAAHTRIDDGGGVTSVVANLDRSWLWKERNVYGYVEYFRNGFGEPSLDRPLEELDPSLLERLVRGELFNLGRDELGAGLRLEWTPRLLLEPVLILNLNDLSALVQLKLRYDWLQDLLIDAGAQAGLGPADTEYGGAPTASGALLAPGRRLWVRLSRYF